MQSHDAPLDLQPNGLYILLSMPKSHNVDTSSPPPTSLDGDDEFEWGFYWSRSLGVGQSFRYKKRNGIWQYEQVRIPSFATQRRIPVEENDRVILALHIENMMEDMENLLGETLSPRRFPHSLSARASTSSQVDADEQQEHTRSSDGKSRSRYWLGHALVVLNEAGFIGLKEGIASAGLIEREALMKATENISYTPARRTVQRTEHAIFDNEGPRPR